MPRFTAWVPDYGFVSWPVDQLAAHVNRLATQHRPRWRPGGRKCRACGAPWPCVAHAWAARQIVRFGEGNTR